MLPFKFFMMWYDLQKECTKFVDNGNKADNMFTY